MTSVIFVHGTGGRQHDYAVTFQQIENALLRRRPNAKLIPCLWGEPLGAKLNADGASIPTYDESQGGKKPTPEEENIRLWEALYKDPFYEIRLLGLRLLQSQNPIPGRLTPSQEIKGRIADLTKDATLQTKLDTLEIGEFFGKACKLVTGSDSQLFGRLLETSARPLDDDYAAIARAIVAMTGVLYQEQEWFESPLVDCELRDKAIDAILKVLARDETSRGVVPAWFKRQFLSVALDFGTHKIKRKRGAMTDGAYPFAGDIMVYQAKGKKIRDFIRSQIEQVEPPVVLLAHS